MSHRIKGYCVELIYDALVDCGVKFAEVSKQLKIAILEYFVRADELFLYENYCSFCCECGLAVWNRRIVKVKLDEDFGAVLNRRISDNSETRFLTIRCQRKISRCGKLNFLRRDQS